MTGKAEAHHYTGRMSEDATFLEKGQRGDRPGLPTFALRFLQAMQASDILTFGAELDISGERATIGETVERMELSQTCSTSDPGPCVIPELEMLTKSSKIVVSRHCDAKSHMIIRIDGAVA